MNEKSLHQQLFNVVLNHKRNLVEEYKQKLIQQQQNNSSSKQNTDANLNLTPELNEKIKNLETNIEGLIEGNLEKLNSDPKFHEIFNNENFKLFIESLKKLGTVQVNNYNVDETGINITKLPENYSFEYLKHHTVKEMSSEAKFYMTSYNIFCSQVNFVLNHVMKAKLQYLFVKEFIKPNDNSGKKKFIIDENGNKIEVARRSTTNIIRIFVDGGCKSKARIGYIGISIYMNDTNILQVTGNIGEESTNNTAEYFSMLFSLVIIDFMSFISFPKYTKIFLYGDSELMIKQINGKYDVKTDHIVILHATVSIYSIKY